MKSNVNQSKPLGRVNNHFGMRVNEIFVRRANGVRESIGKRDDLNLILDTGMQDIGQRELDEFLNYMHFGSGGSSNTLDSGVTTMTQSGTIVTANAAIFSAGDVGALIKPDAGGEEVYITTFNSTTEVVVDTSQTVAATEFTIWYVDQTTLETEIARTNTTTSALAASFSAGVVSLNITHLSSAVSGSHTVREIGWGNDNSTTIGARVVLGSTVTMANGDQLEVEATMELTQSPTTPEAVDPTSDEGDFAGTQQVENVCIDNLSSSDALEPHPASAPAMGTSSAATAFRTYQEAQHSTIGGGLNLVDAAISRGSDPSAAPWQRTYTATFDSGSGNTTSNGTIGSIYIRGSGVNAQTRSAFRILLTTPQVKTSDQTLVVKIIIGWSRQLSN